MEFTELWTGHKSKKTLKLLLSKLMTKIESDQYEHHIRHLDKLELNQKVKYKFIDGLDNIFLSKLLTAKIYYRNNIGLIQKLIENHECKYGRHNYVKPYSPTNATERAYLILGDVKFFNLLNQYSVETYSLFNDTLTMTDKLWKNSQIKDEHDIPLFELNRLKEVSTNNLTKFHDFLAKEIATVESKKQNLKIIYSKFSLELEKINLKDYYVKLPKSSADLIYASQILHNCLSSYVEKVFHQETTVLLFYDKTNTKLEMAAQINIPKEDKEVSANWSPEGSHRLRLLPTIVQFKMNHNKDVSPEICAELKTQLNLKYEQFLQNEHANGTN
jgi:flagellar hook-basal body complex protein FliE